MEFLTQHYPCASCHNTTSRQLLQKTGFNIVQCCQCNFVYVNPRIKNDQLASIYQHSYFKNKDYGYVGYEQEKRLRVKNFERWLKDAAKFMPRNTPCHALDIGCAAGYCLEIMGVKGWQSEGLELDEEMCINLNLAGQKVHHCAIEDFESKIKYEVITLFDVIEHITALDVAFKKLNNIIASEGIIIIVTPNYNSMQRKLFKKKWFQFKPIEHIQYFTSQTLEVFAKRNGLKVVYHKNSGQYADVNFLINRLNYYKLEMLSKIFTKIFHLLNLKQRLIYTDTGSLFVILKKV